MNSVTFVYDPSKPDPAIGPFLGELTNEMKPEQFIEEFANHGAKTPAFQTSNIQCSGKGKGFHQATRGLKVRVLREDRIEIDRR